MNANIYNIIFDKYTKVSSEKFSDTILSSNNKSDMLNNELKCCDSSFFETEIDDDSFL